LAKGEKKTEKKTEEEPSKTGKSSTSGPDNPGRELGKALRNASETGSPTRWKGMKAEDFFK
jgi:hypothetical protein